MRRGAFCAKKGGGGGGRVKREREGERDVAQEVHRATWVSVWRGRERAGDNLPDYRVRTARLAGGWVVGWVGGSEGGRVEECRSLKCYPVSLGKKNT